MASTKKKAKRKKTFEENGYEFYPVVLSDRGSLDPQFRSTLKKWRSEAELKKRQKNGAFVDKREAKQTAGRNFLAAQKAIKNASLGRQRR